MNRTNVKVSNMIGNAGNPVRNQFIISTYEGVYFQSYYTVIAYKPYNGDKIQLDKYFWDYSVTTGKYRNMFLHETKKETEQKIKDGIYELVELN